MQDEPVERDMWEAYYLYQEYLVDFLERVRKFENTVEVKQNKGN